MPPRQQFGIGADRYQRGAGLPQLPPHVPGLHERRGVAYEVDAARQRLAHVAEMEPWPRYVYRQVDRAQMAAAPPPIGRAGQIGVAPPRMQQLPHQPEPGPAHPVPAPRPQGLLYNNPQRQPQALPMNPGFNGYEAPGGIRAATPAQRPEMQMPVRRPMAQENAVAGPAYPPMRAEPRRPPSRLLVDPRPVSAAHPAPGTVAGINNPGPTGIFHNGAMGMGLGFDAGMELGMGFGAGVGMGLNMGMQLGAGDGPVNRTTADDEHGLGDEGHGGNPRAHQAGFGDAQYHRFGPF